MNIQRAVDAVLLAHQQGGKVLDRDAAEALVYLVLTALGLGKSSDTGADNV